MSECKECYSQKSRITPLLKAQNCLDSHKQYICGTCGRCICIDKDENRNVQRWNFPFKSLEIAKLYLRTADFTIEKPCGVYELTSSNGRKSYKILASSDDLKNYLNKNKDKTCELMEPVYIKEEYNSFKNTKVKYLTKREVEKYLIEQAEFK